MGVHCQEVVAYSLQVIQACLYLRLLHVLFTSLYNSLK